MLAIISLEPKSSMQSGLHGSKNFKMIFEKQKDNSNSKKYISNPMSWVAAKNSTHEQVKLTFSTLEEAINFAESSNLHYKVIDYSRGGDSKSRFKAKSYSDNFS